MGIYIKNPEFQVDFRSERIIHKMKRKKDNPEKLFVSNHATTTLGLTFFGFLEKVCCVLSWGLFVIFDTKIRNPRFKG
jgi:hypothetical protein